MYRFDEFLVTHKQAGHLFIVEGNQPGRRCCIWSVCGMVKSRHRLASDRQGQLVERGRQAPSHWLVDRELVVASS